MNKLTQTAKRLDKFFHIMQIVTNVLWIGALACIGFLLVGVIFRLDPEMIGTGYENIDVGFLELTIAEAFAPDKWLVLLQAAITLLVSCRLLYEGRRGVGYIREILHPMKEEKPFDTIVSTNLRKLAKLSITLGILGNIIILSDQIMTVFVCVPCVSK